MGSGRCAWCGEEKRRFKRGRAFRLALSLCVLRGNGRRKGAALRCIQSVHSAQTDGGVCPEQRKMTECRDVWASVLRMGLHGRAMQL